MSPKKLLILLLLLVCFTSIYVLLLEYYRKPDGTPEIRKIVTMEAIGGLRPPCLEEKGCETVNYINSNHEIYLAFTRETVSLTESDYTKLLSLIEKTDFTAVELSEFKGLCPSAYDGLEYLYTFITTSGIKHELSSCKQDLKDVEITNFTQELFNTYSSKPPIQ